MQTVSAVSFYQMQSFVKIRMKNKKYNLLYFRLNAAQAELDEVMSVLKEKQDKLAAVEAKVSLMC